MIYLIDHRDSFTFNIAHMLEVHAPVRVVDYTELPALSIPKAAIVVLSPGPGCPQDYPETIKWYLNLAPKQPVLGICLGFQMLVHAAGGRIVRQGRVMHGVRSELAFHAGCEVYGALQKPVYVGRYHALMAEPKSLPECFALTGWDAQSGAPLAIEHLTLPHLGVQYHPDSFLTAHGASIIANLYRKLGRRG